MAGQTAPKQNSGNTPAAPVSPPEDAAEKTVPEIIRSYRINFELMSKQLRFGRGVESNEDQNELGENDIKEFISEIMKFSDYVDKWETNKADLSKDISLDGIKELLPEIVVKLNTALRVDMRLMATNPDIVQFDKGSEAYFTRLKEGSKLISDMLKNCFEVKG